MHAEHAGGLRVAVAQGGVGQDTGLAGGDLRQFLRPRGAGERGTRRITWCGSGAARIAVGGGWGLTALTGLGLPALRRRT
ncbi:hypothetical protein [Actinokineospora alba]|uniref:hypothetical protein n=1 Tax=Actinokineospora alba TaxID=504798 RepID=UPI0015A24201|nr:hypothetical protein [Actinokineospora alba]